MLRRCAKFIGHFCASINIDKCRNRQPTRRRFSRFHEFVSNIFFSIDACLSFSRLPQLDFEETGMPYDVSGITRFTDDVYFIFWEEACRVV